jgi:hypothetical protein
MEKTEETGLSGLIESVGGADTFVWLVMFIALILFVGVMAFLNRNAERD